MVLLICFLICQFINQCSFEYFVLWCLIQWAYFVQNWDYHNYVQNWVILFHKRLCECLNTTFLYMVDEVNYDQTYPHCLSYLMDRSPDWHLTIFTCCLTEMMERPWLVSVSVSVDHILTVRHWSTNLKGARGGMGGQRGVWNDVLLTRSCAFYLHRADKRLVIEQTQHQGRADAWVQWNEGESLVFNGFHIF